MVKKRVHARLARRTPLMLPGFMRRADNLFNTENTLQALIVPWKVERKKTYKDKQRTSEDKSKEKSGWTQNDKGKKFK